MPLSLRGTSAGQKTPTSVVDFIEQSIDRRVELLVVLVCPRLDRRLDGRDLVCADVIALERLKHFPERGDLEPVFPPAGLPLLRLGRAQNRMIDDPLYRAIAPDAVDTAHN